MLKEIKELQDNAVKKLITYTKNNDKITFKSPTGSGKTYMMASFMNRILKKDENVIFLVSSLSKSELAKQNYEKFNEYRESLNFLNPYLINTNVSGEEDVYIPDANTANIFILPTDLYKSGGKIVNAFNTWLIDTKALGKKIYLIKDEAHSKTANLDNKSNYFDKQIDISATPKLSKGQIPNVEITDLEAENAKLIKHVYQQESNYNNLDDCAKSLDKALFEFKKIKKEYINKSLGIHPCFIIQVSNKGKVEDELKIIKKVLNNNHRDLNWMYIVTNQRTAEIDSKILNEDDFSGKHCSTNDEGLKKISPSKWKDLAKSNVSTTDIIIFKLSIKEGWDIPRACMLFQMRDTQSETLDEQVIGRIRRNPRLKDFEKLTPEQQNLCLKAYVWGVRDKTKSTLREVICKIDSPISIKTTKLKEIKTTSFDLNKCLNDIPETIDYFSIFTLYEKLQNSSKEISDLYKDYVKDSETFFKFTKNIPKIKSDMSKVIKDYDKYMYIPTDDKGQEIEHILKDTYYSETVLDDKKNNFLKINDWIWQRIDNNNEYSFDSEAEEKWAEILIELTKNTAKKECIDGNEVNIWAKNFIAMSEICFEYFSDSIHKSFPDFIFKDKKDGIHFFEVKSLIPKTNSNIDNQEYIKKINCLKECYPHCARLTGYHFYIPIMHIDNYTGKSTWTIWYTYRKKDKSGKIDIITGEYTHNEFIIFMNDLVK